MNKTFAAFTTTAIAALLTVASVSPVSAHTGDLLVEATCNTSTGLYDLTAALTVAKAGDRVGKIAHRVGSEKFDGTPKSDKGMVFVAEIQGDGTYDLPGYSLPGTTTGLGPWVYTFTTFANSNVTVGSDGRLKTELKGDCEVTKPEPKEPLVEFGEWYEADIVCDATEVVTKREVFTTPYVYDEKTNTYVAGETVTTTEEGTRQLTEVEVEENLCPTPVETQLPTSSPPELARTGFPVIPVALFGSVLLGLGALMKKRKAVL